MTRRIELELEGVSAVARLLDEVAPETTRSLWELLPLEETLRHLAWAGEGVWISTRRLRDANLPLENRVSFYHPGMINCRPESGEIAFCYGQAQARTLYGHAGNIFANHFASFEGDFWPLLNVAERTHLEGAKQLTIRRKED